MVELRLDELAEKMGGKILQGGPSLTFQKFNIDSRLSVPGELFFAIVARRNGHDFIADAAHRGASGAVVSQEIPFPNRNFAIITVKDTVEALKRLAQKVLSEQRTRVVGITGSIGKTTTKEFASTLLSKRFRVLKSEGNFNNYLGLSLSLLRIEKSHEVAILEMGTSGLGEIRTLARIAPPDVSVITNINPVHLEFFGSLENIARAKKEILEGTKEDGIAVLNGDDSLVRKIGKDWKGKKITFGLSARGDIQARKIEKRGYEGIFFELGYGGKKEKIRFPFLYESYLYNFLAALGVCQAFSLSLEDILGRIMELRPFQRRGTLIPLRRNIQLIDDSYNSNPRALEEALKGLSSLPSKRKIAVLGDMLELGEKEREFHIKAGKWVVKYGWNILITVGPLSQKIAEGALSSGMRREQIFSFKNSEEAAENTEALLEEGDLVLVKGSRAIETEKIVDKLRETLKDK